MWYQTVSGYYMADLYSTDDHTLPVLYHAVPSFYSQLCRLALTERGITYANSPINLPEGENRTEAYIRKVNPKGTVPTLKHDGTSYTDSKDIIQYADTLPSNRPRLCPHGDSDDNERIRHFWDSMLSLNMIVISYGAMYHRDLTINCLPPRMIMGKKQIWDHFTKMEEEATTIKRDHVDLSAGMKERHNFLAIREMVADKATVLRHWQECDNLLGEVEEQLKNQMGRYGNANDIENWLCGKNFSVADVYLSCLLHRLTFVGLAERLFLSKRPLTADYYQRVLRRESFAKEVGYVNNIFWSFFLPMLRSRARRACPYFLAGVVAGIGIYIYVRITG